MRYACRTLGTCQACIVCCHISIQPHAQSSTSSSQLTCSQPHCAASAPGWAPAGLHNQAPVLAISLTCCQRCCNCWLPYDLQELAKLHIDVVTVPRGGETTYHGPGQIVAYPILNLRQLGLGARAFVEGLEDAMIQAVGCFGIQVGAQHPLRISCCDAQCVSQHSQHSRASHCTSCHERLQQTACCQTSNLHADAVVAVRWGFLGDPWGSRSTSIAAWPAWHAWAWPMSVPGWLGC